MGNWDFKTWGVSGNFLNGYYVFEETNPNTYWIDEMPLSLTLGTSYPLSLEVKYYAGNKDNEPSLGSQLISIGAKVADDIELILKILPTISNLVIWFKYLILIGLYR